MKTATRRRPSPSVEQLEDRVALNATTGQWSAPLAWPSVPIHANVLPTGKILTWDHRDPAAGSATFQLWDPSSQAFANVPSPGYDMLCTGQAFLPDGRLLVTGGHLTLAAGLPNASVYNPATNTWTAGPAMNDGRFYPTNTTLANGDVLVQAGNVVAGKVNPLLQVWQTATGSWRDLTSAQQGAVPEWADYYPFAFQAPNGKVFVAGPQQTSRYLDVSGTGTWTAVANSSLPYRDYGTAVMVEPGKVLLIGGTPSRDASSSPSASAEVIDLNAPAPAWRGVAPMAAGRRNHNAALLPTGEVLVVGGSSAPGFNNETGAVLHAELWNPATETWSRMAELSRYRGYHSSALLLPDGRVWVGTGGHPPADAHPEAQVYSPPYLFKGPRPTITAAPMRVEYGQPFSVTSSQVSDIASVTWVRLPSATHGFDQSQRFNRLDFTRSGSQLTVTAPASPNLAPPGHYMLFAVNRDGVPSEARIVQIVGPGVNLTLGGGVIAVAEGGTSDTYDLRLNVRPTANVTISLAPEGQAEVFPSSLTFTPDNWDRPRTIIVTALDDAASEGPHTGFIAHTVASADSRYDGASVGKQVIQIADNDMFGVLVNPTGATLAMTEGGGSASYSVVLAGPTTANVTITLRPDGQLSVSPATLTFTPSNWSVPQTVTVTAATDDLVEVFAQQSFVDHGVSSADPRYAGLSPARVAVTVHDGAHSTNHRWMGRMYHDFLGRPPSVKEADAWLALVPQHGWTTVAYGILRSPEAVNRLADRLYSHFLGRAAEPTGHAAWAQLIAGGTPLEVIVAGFLDSPEFAGRANALAGAARPDENFVRTMYSLLLRRAPTEGEVNAWLAALPALGRHGVTLGFLGSAEFRNAAVSIFYGDPAYPPLPFLPDLLHRGRRSTDAEVAAWATQPVSLFDLEVGFALSPEYFADAHH